MSASRSRLGSPDCSLVRVNARCVHCQGNDEATEEEDRLRKKSGEPRGHSATPRVQAVRSVPTRYRWLGARIWILPDVPQHRRVALLTAGTRLLLPGR